MPQVPLVQLQDMREGAYGCKVGRNGGDQHTADSTDSQTPPQIGQDENVRCVAEHQ